MAIFMTLSSLDAQSTSEATVSMTGSGPMGNIVTVNLNIMTADAGCLEASTLYLMIPVGVTVCDVMGLNGTTWTATNEGTYGSAPETPYQVFSFVANASNDMTDTPAGMSVDVFSFEIKGCTAGQVIRFKEPNSALGGLAMEAPDREFAVANGAPDHSVSLIDDEGTGMCGDDTPNGTALQGIDGTASSLTCPVPVELTSFNATAVKTAISLDWVSVSEIDFNGYQLERSLDGVSFEKLAWVQGSENSLEEKQYNYLDLDVKGGIIYYYRLKMIDLDESYEYSAVRSAQLGAKGNTLEVFPNPTKEAISLTIDVPKDDRVSIRFFDATGKVALERVQDLNEGNNALQFDVTALPSGLYRVVVAGSQIRATESVVVMD